MVALCLPTMIYIAFAAASFIGLLMKGANALAIMLTFLSTGIWALVLQMFCSAGYPWISWVILLFPLIVLAVVFIFAGELLLSSSASMEAAANKA
jgi:hypothetical protein